MEWIAERLAQIRRRPADLARHLEIAGPRVYEMIAGRRALQTREMGPTAEFLELKLEDINVLLQGGKLRDVVTSPGFSGGSTADLPRDIPIRETVALPNGREFTLGKTVIDYARRPPRLAKLKDVFGVIMRTDEMIPWREVGEQILFTAAHPVVPGDYALIEKHPVPSTNGNKRLGASVVRRIVSMNATKVRVRQYNPAREYDIPRKSIATIYRVIPYGELIS